MATTATQDINRDRDTMYLGMIIALGSWFMLFATLFFGYAVYRIQAVDWHYLGADEWPFRQAVVNTAIILASSITYFKGIKAVKAGSMSGLIRQLWITLALGGAFFLMQGGLWKALMNDGMTVQSSTAGSIIYLLTGFHAAHIFGGILAVAWVLSGIHRGKVTATDYVRADLVGYFWHFLTVIWMIMFGAIFVIR